MKKLTKYAILALIAAVLFWGAQRILMPKYMTGIYEGALIREYYAEEKNHEVMIIGDCEVYENISPITLWRNYGITSYIRGSAQQLIWQSYYLLEETLRYEKPKVVIFSVLSLKYNEPQSESYNRLTLDGMKPSRTKYEAVRASVTGDESIISYFFPVLRYHDRWRELDVSDFKYFWKTSPVSHNGFMMRMDVKPADVIPTGPKLNNYRFGNNSYAYLDKITSLCKENDIELLLIKAPSIYPYWYPEWEQQMQDYAAENDLNYINTLDCLDEIGLDFGKHTYDGGLHLNCQGAEFLADYLGKYLISNYGLTDYRENPGVSEIYNEKARKYDAMKDAQVREIAETGKVLTFILK